MNNRRKLVIALSAGALAAPLTSFAQQKGKVWRIGFLGPASPSTFPTLTEAFRQGLRDLGHIEGKNIVIEYRWAEGNAERLPGLAAELARLKPDVILTSSPQGAVAAKNLLAVQSSLGDLRGRWFEYRGCKLAVTYHPAFLLRDPRQKAETWKDLQMVMKELGLKAPAKSP